ncbi:hypothetical protein EJ04DRAFT_574427 [Polyplosphaeria fusca]|uniref:Thioesterase domain-containing protein n=1 Tax=Polyplosphaeria fusca TaxID=682080 RepID=A0A9P4V2R2_9PLEO|nr:hypothetical protein EJ04DRAFT_574427 [Polyplosphaeria fusca]
MSHLDPSKMEHMEDFTSLDWCNTLLSDPSITEIPRRLQIRDSAPNTFFTKTLITDDGVRAFLALCRSGRGRPGSPTNTNTAGIELLGAETSPTSSSGTMASHDHSTKAPQPSLDDGPESLLLVSLGAGLDGGLARLHGGVTATLLDQVMGTLISYMHENVCATAELTVKYKRMVRTPCVLLCRGRIAVEKGRWIETIGSVEDGNGTVFAEGTGSFVKSKVEKLDFFITDDTVMKRFRPGRVYDTTDYELEKADTIHDLAVRLGTDADALETAVKEFNDPCDSVTAFDLMKLDVKATHGLYPNKTNWARQEF